MNSIKLLLTLLVIFAVAQVSAHRGKSSNNRTGEDNHHGGKVKPFDCAKKFLEECGGSCKNETKPLAKFECHTACFKGVAELANCTAPKIPPGALRFMNCSDVLFNKCSSCNDLDGLDRLLCFAQCTKNSLPDFKDCKRDRNDTTGFPEPAVRNCSRVVFDSCKNCLAQNLTLPKRFSCLHDCLSGSGDYNKCSKPPGPQANCTAALEVCQQCANSAGRDKLKCLKDCVNNGHQDLKQCSFNNLSDIPGMNTLPAPCIDSIKINCLPSCPQTDLRDKVKCILDCAKDQPECSARVSEADCIKKICAACDSESSPLSKALCVAKCTWQNRQTIKDCVKGN
jgi:hypothetical protein